MRVPASIAEMQRLCQHHIKNDAAGSPLAPSVTRRVFKSAPSPKTPSLLKYSLSKRCHGAGRGHKWLRSRLPVKDVAIANPSAWHVMLIFFNTCFRPYAQAEMPAQPGRKSLCLPVESDVENAG